MSASWSPGPLPAESSNHNHSLTIGYCTQQCPAYTARPEGLPRAVSRCVWCGARALAAPDGGTEWLIRIGGPGRPGCDHELLEP